MCMKNINATLLFCSKINDENNRFSLIDIFDNIIPIRENDSYYLEDFNIVLNCNIIFDETFKNNANCLQLDKEYEFMVWLTHVESGLGIPLYKNTFVF